MAACSCKSCCVRQGVFTAAVEAGVQTFVFASDSAQLADDWGKIAAIRHKFWLEDEAAGGRQSVTDRSGEFAVSVGTGLWL